MRIVMPLFDYASTGIKSFSFGSFPFSIEPLKADEIIDTKLFSAQDINYMQMESWCLVFNSAETQQYVEELNLLIMAFRISTQSRGPFIKYFLCKDDPLQCRRLNDPMFFYNYTSILTRKIFNQSDLEKVDSYFGRLIEMKSVSIRTKNALYFTFRGMSSTKWIDAFMMFMAALESLFSKDTSGGATKIIKARVSSLLYTINGTTEDDVGTLYDLRSKMTHGRIEVGDDPKENLQSLAKLQQLLHACLDILLNKELYKHYATKTMRDKFMDTLNNTARNNKGLNTDNNGIGNTERIISRDRINPSP